MKTLSFVLISILILPVIASADICSRNLLVINQAERALEKKCSQIEVKDLSSIKQLHLSFYHAPDDYPRTLLASDLFGFNGLEDLSLVLAGNKYSYDVQNDLLVHVPQIKKLHIGSRDFPPAAEFFKNLSQLEDLSLQAFGSGNLKEILALHPQLKVLSVIDAGLGYEKGYGLFSGSAKLEKLNLSSYDAPYWIPSDLFDGLTSLKELTFSVYEFGTTSKSTIHKDIFSKLTQLEVLHLSLETVPRLEPELLSQNTKLKELSVMARGIKEIPPDFFKTLTNLEDLMMTGWWNLKEFPEGLLAQQKQLKTLYAYRFLGRGNNGISPTFLKGLTQLQEIHLSNNALTSIPLELFEDVAEDSAVSLGWGNEIPLDTRKALRAKYPKMKFSFE